MIKWGLEIKEILLERFPVSCLTPFILAPEIIAQLAGVYEKNNPSHKVQLKKKC